MENEKTELLLHAIDAKKERPRLQHLDIQFVKLNHEPLAGGTVYRVNKRCSKDREIQLPFP